MRRRRLGMHRLPRTPRRFQKNSEFQNRDCCILRDHTLSSSRTTFIGTLDARPCLQHTVNSHSKPDLSQRKSGCPEEKKRDHVIAVGDRFLRRL